MKCYKFSLYDPAVNCCYYSRLSLSVIQSKMEARWYASQGGIEDATGCLRRAQRGMDTLNRGYWPDYAKQLSHTQRIKL
jgi:hypothetical protein